MLFPTKLPIPVIPWTTTWCLPLKLAIANLPCWCLCCSTLGFLTAFIVFRLNCNVCNLLGLGQVVDFSWQLMFFANAKKQNLAIMWNELFCVVTHCPSQDCLMLIVRQHVKLQQKRNKKLFSQVVGKITNIN